MARRRRKRRRDRLDLQDLPEEILEAILGRLSALQLSQARLSCRTLAAVGKRPHLPPRQEQLQLALDAVSWSRVQLVIPGWTWKSDPFPSPTTGPAWKRSLLRQPELTATLRHMAVLNLSHCGLELVIARLYGSTALRALHLNKVETTDWSVGALGAAGILGGLEHLELNEWMGRTANEGVYRVLASPGLEGLRSLRLKGTFSFLDPPDALAGLAKMERLESLSLDLEPSWAPKSRSLMVELLGALRQLKALTSLELQVVGSPGLALDTEEPEAVPQHRAALKALVASLTNLTHLGLEGQGLGLNASLAPATRLTSLDVTEYGRNWRSAWMLAKSTLGQLRALRAHGDGFPISQGPQGVAQAATMTSLQLSGCHTADMLPLPEGLTSLALSLRGSRLGSRPVEDDALLRGVGSLQRLATLNLGGIRLAGGAWGHLAAGSRLTALDLRRCHVADAEFAVLAGSRGFSNLKSLSVVEDGLSLKYLGLPGVPFTASAVRQLVDSPWLHGLETLTLWSEGVGNEAAAMLAAAEHLSRLTRIELRGCRIGDEGARALAESQSLRDLAHLRLDYNVTTHVGCDYLAHATSLVSLKDCWV